MSEPHGPLGARESLSRKDQMFTYAMGFYAPGIKYR